MVEMALAAPLFFAILIGLFEGGRYVYFSQLLDHATREGARYAIVHGSNSTDPTGPNSPDPGGNDVRAAVVEAASPLINSAGEFDVLAPCWRVGPLPPSGTCPQTNNDRGTTVDVIAAYTYSPVVPIFGPLTIRAETSLVINN
jgi:hypothetical protein